MNKTTALTAAAAFIASTTLVTAFYAPNPIDVAGHVQLAQAKMDDTKKGAMPADDKMAKDKMEKDKMAKDKMEKDKMKK